jgi:hypothetical protein
MRRLIKLGVGPATETQRMQKQTQTGDEPRDGLTHEDISKE